MVQPVNEWLRDEAISHQVDLAHFSNGVVRRLIALLNRVDADLAAKLSAAIESVPPGSSLSIERMNNILNGVRQVVDTAYASAFQFQLPEELKQFVDIEAGWQLDMFRHAVGGQDDLVVPVSVDQTYGAAMARPFQGRLLSEWAAALEEDRMARIRDTIRIGFVENQTNDQIVRGLRGTRAAGYADGVLEIDRRNAEAVVRTAVQHVAGFTRDTFMDKNDDLITSVTWVSTLDARTTPQCRIRDGLEYTVDGKPIGHSIPWGGGPGRLHWNCRSTSAPVVKSWEDLGINAAELSATTRASMDGQVPADTTYGQWLKGQSAARQDEVLGATRGKLFRDGGISFDRFYNDKGTYLDLDELQARNAAAFTRAGV